MVSAAEVRQFLEEVSDPEIPVLTIIDLGVVQEIYLQEQTWIIELTPTYSGCPAMQQIEVDLLAKLREKGIANAKVKHILSPAWTTDWISPAGRRKLQDYGIAPPGPVASALTQPLHFVAYRAKPAALACPRCDSHRTERLSAFGSTACKSLHRCLDCLEPFEHFKPI